ncbi:hypothetical protein LJ707_08775 [Mucilaginibacter sp. UR6-1]|uniref:LPO_1073/Vpar_1526 family protein n=1 Tax=Mucilaginibacter sp. UR6-1 TaxID=1435643 RepID=UPI001E47BC2C|nr:LPO_1073/Vpar_1526 family protein [Mucilaginibacter sp. UR6-1]MCC8409022.1 hypothetical protein [Mucilaginibacter sp. UR6-1]
MRLEAGENSENIQAGRDVVINGLDYQSTKAVALDVFNANIETFVKKAVEIAQQRNEEFTEKFVRKTFEENASLAEKFQEPAVQSSIFNAQKEYAKSGDIELESHLVKLLVERIKADESSLEKIVYDEALLSISKLTSQQRNLSTLIYLISSITYNNINNVPLLDEYFRQRLLIFYSGEIFKQANISHLQFCGCCILLAEGNSYKSVAELHLLRYKGLFSKGFSLDQLKSRIPDIHVFENLLIKCLRDPSLIQIGTLTDSDLTEQLNELISPNIQVFRSLWEESSMSSEEVEQLLSESYPNARELQHDWKKSSVKSMHLTPVGQVIAILNYNQYVQNYQMPLTLAFN